MLPEYNVLTFVIAILMAAAGLTMVITAIYLLTRLIQQFLENRRARKKTIRNMIRGKYETYCHQLNDHGNMMLLFTKTADLNEAKEIVMVNKDGVYFSIDGKNGPFAEMPKRWTEYNAKTLDGTRGG